MIKQIAHLCIHANDLERSRHFYHDILGLEIKFEFEKNGKPFGYYFHVGNNTFIEVFKGDPSENGKIRHLAIEVENIDAVICKLRSNGVKCADKKLGADNSWQVWTSDPDGVPIEFHEYSENSMQIIGGKCIVNW